MFLTANIAGRLCRGEKKRTKIKKNEQAVVMTSRFTANPPPPAVVPTLDWSEPRRVFFFSLLLGIHDFTCRLDFYSLARAAGLFFFFDVCMKKSFYFIPFFSLSPFCLFVPFAWSVMNMKTWYQRGYVFRIIFVTNDCRLYAPYKRSMLSYVRK